jgi:hypothetical protein
MLEVESIATQMIKLDRNDDADKQSTATVHTGIATLP